LGSGPEALGALDTLKPRFHPDPVQVGGALENQFVSGPREVAGAGGASYAISRAVLEYLAGLTASESSSIESGCGYTTVVLANVFGTHICVNPDVSSNRLVREFLERHFGSTGLRHVELSSDQGLPMLVTEQTQVDLALIDGNHSHPFPLVDFHYMDQMLRPGGRLLVDNTEIPAVQELTDYLDIEAAYEPDRVIGNCAVYRKVADRAFGWKSQTIRRTSEGSDAVRRELARLRLEVTPELRAALSGAGPLPAGDNGAPAASTAQPIPPRPTVVRTRAARLLRRLARWYKAPSGAVAGLALLLLAVGIGASGPWRFIGIAGVALLAAFLPYRFDREQRRNEQRFAIVRRDLTALRSDVIREIRRTVDDATRSIVEDTHRQVDAVARSLGEETEGRVAAVVSSIGDELAALKDATGELSVTLDETIARTKPSRRFAATKAEDPRRPELLMRDATTSLHSASRTQPDDEARPS
jgi:hypothetical protein